MVTRRRLAITAWLVVLALFVAAVAAGVRHRIASDDRREARCAELGGFVGYKYRESLCLDKRTGAVLATWDELGRRPR